MPLINDAGDTTNIIKISTQEDAIVESPDVGATFEAGFRVENSLVSAAANGFSMSTDFTVQEGYDPFAQNEAGETDITGYESFAESFSLSRSEAETQFIKGGVDRELQDRKDLEAAGALGIAAQFAGGALDPLYMLPFLRAGKALTTAGAVAELIRKYKLVSLNIDTLGPGGEVYVILKNDYPCVRAINVSEQASDPLRWINKRAEFYGKLAKRFEMGEISIPDHNDLGAELVNIKKTYNSYNTQIYSKNKNTSTILTHKTIKRTK